MCSMLLGLALFAACSSDDDVVTPQPKSYPLTIEVSENPLIPEGGAASAAATRAAETTISSLDKFNMSYVYEGIENPGSYTDVTCTNGVWGDKTGTAYTWPNGDPDKTVTWYAYTKGSFHLTDDTNKKPYINFEGEEYADAQHDLLVSTTNGTYNSTSGHLYFAFNHVCSALRFFVKKSTNLNDYTVSVSSIKLCKVIKQGRYYFDDDAWVTSSAPAADDPKYFEKTEYTLYSGDAVVLGSASSDYLPIYGTYGTEEDPYLFIIPQTLMAWDHKTPITNSITQSYIEIVCDIKKSDSSSVFSGTAYIPIGYTFVKNKRYKLNLSISKNSLYKYDNNTYSLVIPAS